MQNDHYVSQFILRAFTAVDGSLLVFNKMARKITRKCPAQICYERGFTTFDKNDVHQGWNENFLENELQKWENTISPIHKKLLEHRTIKAIQPEEFWELVRFAVWLYLCNPATRRMLRTTWSEFQLKKVRALRGKGLDRISLQHFGLLLPRDFLLRLLESDAKEDLLQSEFLSLVLGSAESSFRFVMNEYAWNLSDFAKSGCLLCTSDRPVILGTKKLFGCVAFGTAGALLFFPLSPDLCLIGRNVGKDRKFIQDYIVSDLSLINVPRVLMWAKSSKIIIASAESALPPSGAKLPTFLPKVIDLGNKLGMFLR